MPAVVAIAIRYIIMAAVQLGLWSLIEKYGLPLLEKAVIETMKFFGVSEETAKDIMANEVIRAFESVGIFAVTLRTKLPIKVAEFLGFTSKGFAKRKLSLTLEKKVSEVVLPTTTKVAPSLADLEKVSEAISKSTKISVGLVGSLLKQINSNLAGIGIIYLGLINTIDFANWQGAYQKTFQKIFTSLGFPPDSPMPKANTLSSDTWKRIYSTIEELNPVGISFPVSQQIKPYSRANLADMIDELTANLLKNGQDATFKNVIAIALPLVQLKGSVNVSENGNGNFNSGAVAPANANTSVSVAPITKVFTGIVSQGVVGQGLVFTPRPDDLIESAEELRTAAANNLAPFLNTLLGKIVYEVKVVSSIITKEGFKQTGTTQRIKTGTDSKGNAKYKTVTNKFATLVVYALTDKGSRAKLTTIVLGPTDSAKLTVAQSDLRALETELPALITTTDLEDIKEIKTETPIAVTPTTEVKDANVVEVDKTTMNFWRAAVPEGSAVNYDGAQWANRGGSFYRTTDGALAIEKGTPIPKAVTGTIQREISDTKEGYEDIYYPPGTTPNPELKYTGPSTSVKNAKTLSEYFNALGVPLPSVAKRSELYAQFGLGQASFYTGTAEQNTKLLNVLKGQ